MGSYIYIEVFKKILSYYFIDFFQILNRSKLGPTKFINLQRLLICRVLMYGGGSIDIISNLQNTNTILVQLLIQMQETENNLDGTVENNYAFLKKANRLTGKI